MEDAIEYRMKDPELAKTQFLWFQYKPKVYYFEVVPCGFTHIPAPF